MKIFIVCSKAFYSRVAEAKEQLEQAGHDITLPNSFDNPGREDEYRSKGEKDHSAWKAEQLRLQESKIKANDAILVLNFKKHDQENYIGGSTFLEMFKAWELGKKIFLYNPIPTGMLKDEIIGFAPTLIDGDLSKVK